jgi:hypothetical protein
MALTGNTVSSTYLDLIQVEQSGSGLPSHGGAPAALYDGGGNLVKGQLRYLDPYDHDPETIADGTFEWQEDMTQADLVTAGWTFPAGVYAHVEYGSLWIRYLQNDVSWSQGDTAFFGYYDLDTPTDTFIFTARPGMGAPYYPPNSDLGCARNNRIGIAMADTVTTDSWFGTQIRTASSVISHLAYSTMGTYSTATEGTPDQTNIDGYTGIVILTADGTTVRMGVGPTNMTAVYAAGGGAEGAIGASNTNGWTDVTSIASTATFNRLLLFGTNTYDGWTCIGPIRRYA